MKFIYCRNLNFKLLINDLRRVLFSILEPLQRVEKTEGHKSKHFTSVST